jgi:hypothetical protein
MADEGASTAGAIVAGLSAGAYIGDAGSFTAPVSFHAPAIPAAISKRSASNTTSHRLDAAVEVRTILTE